MCTKLDIYIFLFLIRIMCTKLDIYIFLFLTRVVCTKLDIYIFLFLSNKLEFILAWFVSSSHSHTMTAFSK